MKKLLQFLLFILAGPVFAQPNMLVSGSNIKRYNHKSLRDTFHIQLYKGGCFECVVQQEGADVVIDILGPSAKKISTFDSPNGDTGPEKVICKPETDGLYKLVVYTESDNDTKNTPAEAYAGAYEIKGVTILSAVQYRQKMLQEKQYESKTIAWLAASAHPLKTVMAGNGYEDLQWLKPVLQNVRIVGMGEATHGTREFFQMKHRMLEFLVKEMGYTVFAMEAAYAGGKNINDYVLYGKGDAKTALFSQGFWTWKTEEVLDMIEWMHSYNMGVTGDKKLKFYGFDIQQNYKGGGITRLHDYLKTVDPLYAAGKDSLFSRITLADTSREAVAGNGETLKDEFTKLLQQMYVSKAQYVQRSSAGEYGEAHQYAVTILQYLDTYMMADNDPRLREREWRDYYMAENLKAYIRRDTTVKVMVWAHNGHICKNAAFNVNGGTHPLGGYLEETYGGRYYAMGFVFNKGSFQAKGFNNAGVQPIQALTVGHAKVHTLEWLLQQTKKAPFIINFRLAAMPEYVQDFTRKEFIMRNYGAMVNLDTYANDYFTPVTIGSDYDALIFIDETTRAQPLK